MNRAHVAQLAFEPELLELEDELPLVVHDVYSSARVRIAVPSCPCWTDTVARSLEGR